MAWDTEMVTILRVMVNDLDSPYKFNDTRLKQVIIAATQLVNSDAGTGKFAFEYVGDITNLTISPDPTDRNAGTRDDDYVTLTLLKSACFIDNCNARDAARKGGVVIREWNTSLDTKGLFASAIALLQSDKGYCQQYDEAIFQYLAANSAVGTGVFGPFRLIYNAYNATAGFTYSNNELFNGARR